MITKIYSKVDEGKLLHIIVRKQDISEGRMNVVNECEFIQCATLKLNAGTTFRPHRHKYDYQERVYIPQESWVVIRGSVKVFFYDLDDRLIHKDIIEAGEASFTLAGGHNYEILEDDTIVYEYKTGPYLGQEFDKEFINQYEDNSNNIQ